MNAATMDHFDKDIRDVHLLYDYDVMGEGGNPEKWRYEMWFFSEKRIVYSIHGGPMAGRLNYQTCEFQCIRPGELWQCNWLEGTSLDTYLRNIGPSAEKASCNVDVFPVETGTIVSLVYDIPRKRITTMIGFSKGQYAIRKHPTIY